MTVALLPPVILVLSGEAGHRHETKTKTDWHDSQMNRDACASGRLGRMCSENPEVFIAGSQEKHVKAWRLCLKALLNLRLNSKSQTSEFALQGFISFSIVALLFLVTQELCGRVWQRKKSSHGCTSPHRSS